MPPDAARGIGRAPSRAAPAHPSLSCSHLLPPRVVNAALALPAGGVTPLLESLAGRRAAAEVLQGVAQLRNQPGLCNDSLPPPAN